MTCEGRELDLNALIDGELSREAERSLLGHVATCPGCAAELAGLVALRMRLAWLAPVEAPPDALAAKIEHAIAPVSAIRPAIRPARRTWPIVGGMAALALAAALLLVMVHRPGKAAEVQAVADASLRQTLPAASVVLADTRRGGADAWFTRHHLATPPVPDLNDAGFAFLGCRTDVVAGHRASILVYGQGRARLTLVAWPANGEPAHKPREGRAGGRAVSYWNNGALEFWVTGAAQADVARFTAAYRAGV